MSMEKKKQVVIGGKTYRRSYAVDTFNGKLKKYKIGDYYFISVNKKHKFIELSNGQGSFVSYLDPQDALKVAIKGYEAFIESKHEILNIMKSQLSTIKGRNLRDKMCVKCLVPTRLMVHCYQFTQKR